MSFYSLKQSELKGTQSDLLGMHSEQGWSSYTGPFGVYQYSWVYEKGYPVI